MVSGNVPTVLVAVDDPDVRARFQSWLTRDYRVETATNGDGVLSAIEAVDAVLVDRELRTAAGTPVVDELEGRPAVRTTSIVHDSHESSRHCDIDDGLVRPVSRAALSETVDRLLRRGRYDELVAECATLAAECGALEARTGGRSSLEFDGNYVAARHRLEEVFSELDDLLRSFDGEDFRAVFETCTVEAARGLQQAGERS
ncbi:HalX domain-containing protein [Natrinema salsiterrestre]|uniref:HoxA-like transcriptional regulator n=1 Tax=Natrinema salsiterrestre TaxID=2950540 RepID=A0A9Q4L307_9EURY|nr:HalX domain-containing protein [Natrinema salsiterrestre]MDF9746679.1 HoxA-like transcriptional regulator [Natrinema salsiterrestre]